MNDSANKGPSRGGRPLTGRVVKLKSGPHAGQLQGIVTLIDGTTQRLPPFPRGMSLARAKDMTLAKQEAARAQGITKPVLRAPSDVPAEGTVAAWFERFAAFRERRGLTSVKDDRSRFANHVKTTLGALAMATVTREDLEALVRSLDAKVHAQELSWKSAQNVWMLVTKMFGEAVRSKLPELRVRADNPCKDVAAPDRGVSKAKVYLYPSELATFLECDKVPVRWRRMVAVAVYLGVRAGELDALEWGDVDLEHGVVHVHRALDRSRPGKAKSTKTGSARRFRIEPELLPLLAAMREETGGKGTVFPALKLTGRSEKLRMFLLRAGVRRAELHASDATRKPLGWHDLRATSATWLAVRGEEPLKIMQRLGHRNFATTMLYVREAEQLREGFGVPFAPLPGALLRGVLITSFDHEELSVRNYGAGHGARTRDPELGKLVLYQLS
jgi:integrase